MLHSYISLTKDQALIICITKTLSILHKQLFSMTEQIYSDNNVLKRVLLTLSWSSSIHTDSKYIHQKLQQLKNPPPKKILQTN